MPGWDVFPFERAGLQARALTEYADPEPHELLGDLDARADKVRAALAAR